MATTNPVPLSNLAVNQGNNVRPGGIFGCPQGPLDIYSTSIVAAWSMRSLKASFAGSNVATVKRRSDNTTINVTTSAATGVINNADAVTAFVGGSIGVPSPWKDQASTIDLTDASNASLVPPIFMAWQGGYRPGWLGGDYGGTWMTKNANPGISAGQGVSVFICVSNYTGDIQQPEGLIQLDNPSSYFMLFFCNGFFTVIVADNTNSKAAQFNVGAPADGTIDMRGRVIVEAYLDGATSVPTVLINGVPQLITLSSGDTNFTFPAFGANTQVYSTSPSQSGGQGQSPLHEMLLYKGIVPEASRAAIRKNMAAFWGVTL